jgi:hypothetical protein
MKSFKSAVLGAAFSLLALNVVPTALARRQFRGNWSIAPSKQAGMVKFGVSHRGDDGQSDNESDWPVSALQGIDLTTPGKHDVRFTINREAGRIDAEGFMKDGEGAGIFSFTPDPNYVPAMSRLGFGGIDSHMQFAMAIHDVTQEFARTMKAENLSGLDTDKLIAFRIFECLAAVHPRVACRGAARERGRHVNRVSRPRSDARKRARTAQDGPRAR